MLHKTLIATLALSANVYAAESNDSHYLDKSVGAFFWRSALGSGLDAVAGATALTGLGFYAFGDEDVGRVLTGSAAGLGLWGSLLIIHAGATKPSKLSPLGLVGENMMRIGAISASVGLGTFIASDFSAAPYLLGGGLGFFALGDVFFLGGQEFGLDVNDARLFSYATLVAGGATALTGGALLGLTDGETGKPALITGVSLLSVGVITWFLKQSFDNPSAYFAPTGNGFAAGFQW